MNLLVKILNLLSRAVVDSRDSSGRYQVLWGGDRASAGLEHAQPQGLHFRVPPGVSAFVAAPGGDRSAAVVLSAGGDPPGDALPAGAGGLHYLGEWRVFVADDGTVHLGSRDPGDFAARASLVDAEISRIKADLDALKVVLLAHTHTGVTTGPGSSGSPPAIAWTPSDTTPTGSTIVRIE